MQRPYAHDELNLKKETYGQKSNIYFRSSVTGCRYQTVYEICKEGQGEIGK